MGAVQRILSLRHYNGVFSYLPANNTTSTHHSEDSSSANEDESESESSLSGTSQVEKNGLEETPVSDSTNHSSIPHRPCAEEGNNISNGGQLFGPKCRLPSIDEPVPDDWVTMDGEFISVVLSTMSHLGSDTHFTPGLCIGSGSLNLQYVRQARTRKMFQLLSAVDSGKHVDYPEVEIEHVAAFRLTPGPSEVGHICVDGELIDYEPIQGEVYPMLGRVLMLAGPT